MTLRRHALLLVASLLTATVCHAQSALENIQKAKVIRIGIPVDLPPFGSLGPDQQPRGLDIDMARLVAAKLDVQVKLVPVASPQRIPMLQENKLDLVISTLGRNPEREKLIEFSKGYSSFYLAVFGAKGTAVASAADLKGHRVAVTRGSIEDQELSKVVPAGANVERFDDSGAAVKAYVEGKTDLLAVGIGAAMAAAAKSNVEMDMKFVVKESSNHIGMPKGEDKLRDKVNAIIDEATESGELRKMRAKWFTRTAATQ